MSKKISELLELWEEFESVPVDEDCENIDAPFLDFPVGTSIHEIWHWFESENPAFSVGKVANGDAQSCIDDEIEQTVVKEKDSLKAITNNKESDNGFGL